MYVAKCEKDSEPLKVQTDIRQGGLFYVPSQHQEEMLVFVTRN